MAFTDNPQSKRTGIFLVVIIVAIVLLLSFFFGGVGGLWGVIRFFLTAMLVVGFFGFLFYIVYYLFFKRHRRDIPAENWKEYVKSAKENGAGMMQDLILTGDKHHSTKSFMTIKGYLRIQAFDGKQYDLFLGKKNPSNIFEEWKLVMLKPKDHSDLIGDVYVEGISLIQKYGFYFLNSMMLDFKAIDQTVAYDTYRKLIYITLGDMKSVVDRAIGIDPEYQKQVRQEKLLKIPVLQGQQTQQQQQT